MSTPRKLRGGSDSPLTALKTLWRDSLAAPARDYWRALFISATTQAEIRSLVFTKLKIKLTADKQLNAFRAWLDDQDTRDLEAERMAEDERRLTETFGDTLSKDQVREKVLAASYARTLATGDFKLGLATVREDRGLMEANTAREKFEFDATRAALKKLDSLKAIKTNSKLSEDEKLEQARLELFGVAPK